MYKVIAGLAACVILSACATTRPSRSPASGVPLAPWAVRADRLQHVDTWQLDGRAAVAVGSDGWQASLDWRQNGLVSDVHLAGPLGVGALVLTRGPDGLSLNGAPPSDAVVAQVQARLGFELPLDHLRYWLLGVPDPSAAFELTRNAQDRAQRVQQAGWTVDYDKYARVGGDVLPGRLVASREGVRVKIAVDQWRGMQE